SRKMLDSKSIDNCQFSQALLVNNMEASIGYDKSDVDLIYEIMNNKQSHIEALIDSSIDSYESNVEDSVLEDISSNIEASIDSGESYKSEKPAHWCRMPNPLHHHQSFMFSDVLRLTMLMPFILRKFLKPYHIRTEILNNWNIKQNLAISRLCTCWAIEAK
ncbi:12339_t:CDS:2, partial [Dentiscutata erythropus]